MKVLALVFLLVGLTLASVNSETLARFGKTIPLHIPTQTLTVNETFEVPYWLGAYYATVDVPSNWTLPLTIGNGGQTYPGEFLIIRNYGPGSITLYATNPETIEGASSYGILPGAVVGIISGYPSWMITTVDPGNMQLIHMFQGVEASTNDTLFTVEIGTNVYNVPDQIPCENPVGVGNCSNWGTVSIGSAAGQYNTGNRVINIGSQTGQYNTGVLVNNIGASAGRYNIGTNVNNLGGSAGLYSTGSNVNNLGQQAGRNNTGESVNNLGGTAGYANTMSHVNNLGFQTGQFNAGAHVNNLGAQAGQNNTGVSVNNMGLTAGQYNIGSNVNNFGLGAGRNNTGSHCSHNGNNAGVTNTFDYCHTNGRTSVCTAANQFVFGSTLYPLNLRLPSDTGSYCTGASYDTCLNRGRAGAFELPSGQDLYTTGYVCAGAGCTSSAPTSATTGVYDSNIRLVRSCTAGAGITCSVTDGVLTVSATAPELQNLKSSGSSDDISDLRGELVSLRYDNDLLQKRVELLEARIEKLLQLANI